MMPVCMHLCRLRAIHHRTYVIDGTSNIIVGIRIAIAYVFYLRHVRDPKGQIKFAAESISVVMSAA